MLITKLKSIISCLSAFDPLRQNIIKNKINFIYQIKMTNRNRYFQITVLLTIIISAIWVLTFSFVYPCFAEEKNHLTEGITLYNNGLYDEALNEFRDEIEINQHCPLAYYYAAHIRIARAQYPRAIQNIEAALRDSSDFHDAHGLLAFTFLKMGRHSEALAEWDNFVKAVGFIEEKTPHTIESIMFPEEYYNMLRLEAERKERERIMAEKIETERLEVERIEREKLNTGEKLDTEKHPETRAISVVESLTAAEQLPSNIPDEDDTIAEIETPLEDLEKRIKSSIRAGIYGIIAVTCILLMGVLATVYWMRKRKVTREEINFSEEVERLLNDREFELDEEKAIKELEAKRSELIQEEQPLKDISNQVKNPVIEHNDKETIQFHQEKYTPVSMRKSPITDEVKALVSRLYREGHSAEKIAHTADLSKTEVDLILAVREHHMDNLIDEINREEEDSMDRDQLIHAIHDLSAEGANPREIAKKLNISISEVVLASSILEMQKKNSKTNPI